MNTGYLVKESEGSACEGEFVGREEVRNFAERRSMKEIYSEMESGSRGNHITQ